MTEIECPGFSELVVCEMDSGYKIAQGWTASTGQGGAYPYIPHAGWKYDDRYSDIRGPNGSHGGCTYCIMTLVHLITVDPVVSDPCEGIICNDECYGYDMYSQTCVEGSCIQGDLIKANDPECDYISPTPEDPNIFDVINDNKEIIVLGAVAGILLINYA